MQIFSTTSPRPGRRTRISSWSSTAPALRQKDRDARWTLFGKARLREHGTKHADIAIPVFGYKSHASIDRRHGFIRKWDVTDASRHDGRMLRRGLLDPTTPARPSGPTAPSAASRRRTLWSATASAAIEHVFAHQKGPMALCIRTIGIARARVKIGLANLTYNIRRLVFQERRPLAA
jgi:transposase, IS5 family